MSANCANLPQTVAHSNYIIQAYKNYLSYQCVLHSNSCCFVNIISFDISYVEIRFMLLRSLLYEQAYVYN